MPLVMILNVQLWPLTVNSDHDTTTDTSSESASRVSASSEEDASSQTSEPGSDGEETSESRESGPDEEDAKSESETSKTATSSSTGRHQESHTDTQSVQVTTEMKRHGDASRYPDFVGRLSFRDVHRRILFIVEVKRLPNAFVYALGPKPDMQDPRNEALNNIFYLTRRQIAEQVQLAFARYPDEQEIRALCIVGLFFDVLIYKRRTTPAFDEYSDRDPEDYHLKLKGPDHIFNQRFTGYNPVFLREWRSAAMVKVKEIKKLVKDSVKGTMVANPMIQYELISDH